VFRRRDGGKEILYLIITRHRRAIPVKNRGRTVELGNCLKSKISNK
jgi:hypothetical protein